MDEIREAFEVSKLPGLPSEPSPYNAKRAGVRAQARRDQGFDLQLDIEAARLADWGPRRRIPVTSDVLEVSKSTGEPDTVRLSLPRSVIRKLDPNSTYTVRTIPRSQFLNTLDYERNRFAFANYLDARQPLDAPVRDRLRGATFRPTEAPTEVTETLPLVRIHCPWVNGSSTSYVDSQTSQFTREFSIVIGGLGFGDGRTLTCSNSMVLTAAGECMELSTKAVLSACAGEVWLGKTRLLSVIRLDVKRLETRWLKYQSIPRGPSAVHPCGWTSRSPPLPAIDSGGFDFSTESPSKGTIETQISFGDEQKFDSSISIPFTVFHLPVAVSLTAETSFSSKVGLGCKLVGGKQYQWFQAPNRSPLEVFWSSS